MSLPTINHRSADALRFGRQAPPKQSGWFNGGWFNWRQNPIADTPRIKFEDEDRFTAQNGVWVTTERIPAKLGGLGEVSKTIPEAAARLMPRKDIRIIVPYLTPHAEADLKHPDDAFENTGVAFNLRCHDGKERKFEVLQKFEPVPGYDKRDMKKIGNWVYAIRNDELFRAKIKIAGGGEVDAGLQKYTYDPNAGEYEKVMLFNRAAAKVTTLLDGNNPEFRDSKLRRFGDDQSKIINGQRNGKGIDWVMAHDWLAGPVLHELPDDPKTRKIFMLHNKYDKIQIPKVARETGLYTPDSLYDKEELYSPLQLGIEHADAVIGEHNFVETLLNTPVGQGLQFIDALRFKHEVTQNAKATGMQPMIYDMHHGLAADFTPLDAKLPPTVAGKVPPALRQNETSWKQSVLATIENKAKAQKKSAADIKKEQDAFLKSATQEKFQFQPLKSYQLQDIQAFKKANKEALQKKLGLAVNPNATIIGWAARLEPRQKGFYLVQYCMDELLKNKNVQFVIYGDTSDKAMKAWVEKVNKKYGKTGTQQVFLPNAFGNGDDIKHLSSGADFTVLPSIYEPYGLTQLEAMKMCCIPIVHGVDGLRSSVADTRAEIRRIFGADFNNPQKREKVWSYPQNGFLMPPLNLQAYQDYIDHRQESEGVLDAVKMVVQPDGASRKLSQDKRLTILDQRLKDASGSRRNRINNIMKELSAIGKPGDSSGSWFSSVWSGSATQNGGKDPQALQAEAKKLRGEIDTIIRLRSDMDKSGTLTSATQQGLEALFQLSEADVKINERESNKLLRAMQRAIQTPQKALLQIRKNGMEFVDKEHNWDTIVANRYRPVMEDLSNLSLRPERTLPSQQTKAPTRTVTVEKGIVKASKKPQESNQKPSGFVASLRYWWSQFWALQARILAFLLRPFSFKQD